MAKAVDPACELGHNTARITAGEVLGTKVLIASADSEHVGGGRQD
jgi:hypothetical protein